LSVFSLIDLMQEFYHAKHDKKFHSFNDRLASGDHFEATMNAQLAVIVFFVSLREILMVHFLKALMYAKQSPDDVWKRLDNYSHAKRTEKLFPRLTEMKWEDTIEELDKKYELDYVKLNDSIKKIVDARNKFLHDGIAAAINPNMVEECMKNISPLLNLHVSLHNRFIHPIYNEKLVKVAPQPQPTP